MAGIFKKVLVGCIAAAAALCATSAKADISVQFSISATTGVPGGDQGTGALGTWTVYAHVTGTTSTTSGLAGVAFDVVPSGGAFIVDHTAGESSPGAGDGPLDTAFLAPTGFLSSTTIQTGFFQLQDNGGDNSVFPGRPAGSGIAIFQNNGAYRRVNTSTDQRTNLLTGVGIAAGSQNGFSWNDPVAIATGYWGGSGTLNVVSDPGLVTLLPFPLSSTPPATAAGTPVATFSPEIVAGGSVPVGIPSPEPASLGVLAMGGLALLARRRKAA